MQRGTARYGTVRSPMTEWHGSSSILSSLLSSPRRANTLCTHVSVSPRVYARARVSLYERACDHVYLDPPRTYLPSNARLEYFQRLSLPVGINSPYFEDDISAAYR